MTERPILMSAPMVRALLDGRKTQTRRVVKPRHDWHVDEVPDERGVFRPWPVFESYVYAEPETIEVPCPYGEPGDRLWVRETWAPNEMAVGESTLYAADGRPPYGNLSVSRWRPSIHMPRGLSRLTLEVTGVRVERLQDISEEDAKAEGITERVVAEGHNFYPRRFGAPGVPCVNSFGEKSEGEHFHHKAVDAFRSLWESINGPESWAANPWVWAITFKRVTA